MSQLKYCQGPKCLTYDTKDRKKGPKNNKRNETRRRSSFYYLNGNACSMMCQADWFNTYGTRMDNTKYGQVVPEFFRKLQDD